MMRTILQRGVVAALAGLLVLAVAGVPSAAAADDSIFEDDGPIFEEVDYGLLSLGGRATYLDPFDAGSRWLGGAQARLYLGNVFAIEGSVDYREQKFDGTFTRTYPVQVSGLLYLMPGMRLSPFLLGGGGWYYTDVEGPGGLDETQHRFGLHGGGGLQWFFHRRWSIDSTYRYIWVEKITSKDESLLEKDFENNAHMVTIGLNFHF